MHRTHEETIEVRPQRRGRDVQCPRCGQAMLETDRIVENGFAYIWYECSAEGCMEQWLAKRPAVAG
jgi:uncharacterized protein (DUF983 family)